MRIALIWFHDIQLTKISFDYSNYLKGLLDLGHDVIVVASAAALAEFKAPKCVSASHQEMLDTSFWRSLKVDVAISIAWHGYCAQLEAMRQAGATTVALADSDGELSARLFPMPSLRKQLSYHSDSIMRARAAFFWLRRYLYADRKRVNEAVKSTELSNCVILGSEKIKRDFTSVLSHFGRADLVSRLAVVPYAVSENYFRAELTGKKNRIVAVGRWDDPQKNFSLLLKVLQRFSSQRRDWRCTVIGGMSEDKKLLLEKVDGIEVSGILSKDETLAAIRGSRILLSTSLWEGVPNVFGEALVSGCSIVATPYAAAIGVYKDSNFGSIASSFSTKSLLDALTNECGAWNRNQRDYKFVAISWQERLSPKVVCKQLLETVKSES